MLALDRKQLETVFGGSSLFEEAVRKWYHEIEIPRLNKLFDLDVNRLKYRACDVRTNGVVTVLLKVPRALSGFSNFPVVFAQHHLKEDLFTCLTDWDVSHRFVRTYEGPYVFEARNRKTLNYVRGNILGVFERRDPTLREEMFVLVDDCQDMVLSHRGYGAKDVFSLNIRDLGLHQKWHQKVDASVVQRLMTVNAKGDSFGMTVPRVYGEKHFFYKRSVDELLQYSPAEHGNRSWRVIKASEVGKEWPACLEL